MTDYSRSLCVDLEELTVAHLRSGHDGQLDKGWRKGVEVEYQRREEEARKMAMRVAGDGWRRCVSR